MSSCQITVEPCAHVSGRIRVPGDKSISHRSAMLAGLAEGESSIENCLLSEDCVNTLRAMKAMGARVEIDRSTCTVRVVGAGPRLKAPRGPLDMGNSGTGMRLMAGILAGQTFTSEMTGDDSLRSRPMKRIQEPLQRMGAKVELLGPNGCAPVRIRGGKLQGIAYRLPVASAQVKSCVLLAGLFAEGETIVEEPKPTRDHTERILAEFGVPLQVKGSRIALQGFGSGGPVMKGRRCQVPGDFSSAAFWLVAAACRKGSKIVIEGVGLNPRRTALLDVLRRMGAKVRVKNAGPAGVGEPVGDVTVDGAALHGTEVGGDEIPNMIDELPILAVAAAMATGRTTIRDAAELRVKESDRIATTARCLGAFGVHVEELADGMVIHGSRQIHGLCDVHSGGDHRIAMCGAVLGLMADGPTCIHDTACIATSYPGFESDLRTVAQHRSPRGR